MKKFQITIMNRETGEEDTLKKIYSAPSFQSAATICRQHADNGEIIIVKNIANESSQAFLKSVAIALWLKSGRKSLLPY